MTASPSNEPVAAATVVALRDGEEGLRTLLLRRAATGAFGGMWVFPGGRVDPQDADPAAPQDELAAARRAAAREALEEAGLVLDPGCLVPFSHWTPPASAPRRFATWFFVASAPTTAVTVDGAEVDEHAWLGPAEALALQRRGELQLAPPTWVTLQHLLPFDRVSDVLAAAARRTPERFLTRPLDVGGVVVLAWQGDAAYESGEDAPGHRHRLWLNADGWRYERD